ncbi:IS701 family transposase [Arthrobacter sp. AQ5-05]|uniref:IS701 family transposase n=1 Tax=Arthrobacter sp. AQ5-05 TaxID=2184581 RepID=UPI000DCDFE0A|nr:IS701 family transposase [Arthrobacter sp. AQ5-05]RAX49206.1 IS701 family transposase [Arthrobacter sp. AQ5-05]
MQEWAEGLEEIRELIGGEFARTEPRNNAVNYIRGLLSDEERKNSWTLSERAGHGTPDGMQRLLSTTDWDPEAVRDALFGYVKKHLGDPEGILAIDETGFLKKGTASAGVARQYSGTAGRVENCQIGVFLTYASPAGRTFLDRELYLPKAWMDDPERCRRAGIPASREMATKPVLAAEMIERALDAGIEAAWTTGDAVYGQHSGLRRRLEARGMHYVMAVPMNQRAIVPAPGTLGVEGRADQLFAALDGRAWRTRTAGTGTAGTGTKGERLYAWSRIRINGPAETGEHWLLARRSLKDPADLAYFICHAPENTTLIELARVAGARWAIEETFQTSKGETGLDHYQVRQYTGWYRHITLSMFAHAFLSVIRSKKGAHTRVPDSW